MTPYYQDAAVTIYHGDCREIAPSMAVAHVITDPPYATETHEGARGGAGDTKLIDFEPWTAEALRSFYGQLNASRWLVATMDYAHVNALEVTPPSSWVFVRFGVWVKPNGAPQAWRSIRMNAAFGNGLGDATFTTPAMSSRAISQRTAATKSS